MSAGKQASKRLGELFSLVKAVLLGRPNISLDNRRQSQRLRLKVPVQCKVAEREFPGELEDISSTGMRLIVREQVLPDETLRVSATEQTGLVGRQRLICRVAWVRPRRPECEVGLEYNDSDENVAHSWIQLALRHLDPGQVNRKSRRIPANLFVQVSDGHGIKLGRGICVNISTGGCLLQMDRHIPKNEVIKMGLGPSDREASIFLSGRILSHIPSSDHGKCLHHLQFFPGENRNHSRLRSLLLTLLEELELENLPREEPELELEELEAPSLFDRLSLAASPTPAPEPAPEPSPTPGPDRLNFGPGQPLPLGAPVEFGVARRPPEGQPPAHPVPVVPELSAEPEGHWMEKLGAPPPLQTRNYALRSTSLWAARALPVSLNRRNMPKDTRYLDREPDFLPPEARDFLS